MRIFYDIFISLAVILNYIDLGAQFENIPNRETLSSVPHSGTPRVLDRNVSSVRQHFPDSSASAGEPNLRLRSRSPAAIRRPPFRIFGYDIEQLAFIRLIPKKNRHWIFEIHRYTFPADTPAKLRTGSELGPMPTGERFVLTTSNGEIMALLERSNTILRGIYAVQYFLKRVKVNMYSGLVFPLNKIEADVTPTSGNQPIAKNFRLEFIDNNNGTCDPQTI
ncbi:uncharacterized protein LOC117175955 isoform X1 [Belonocnema kinseyi]|uniref:uncharacterized protein LOC117175955 isoform X1 n=1 Tax=Belonocnema kinseyi TaxID=2817044 RepID=UPI00143DC4E7|nr:uncharacterized protein LOC117175955 isoform X1 [Belonocnema kinseyi]